MKVNLLINEKNLAKAGYLNIDPYAKKQDEPLIVEGNPTVLENLVEDGEAEEIIAINIIDYVSHPKVNMILKQFFGKLSHKGILRIGFTDILATARRYYIGQIEESKIAEMLYGKCVDSWDTKKAALTLDSMKTKMEEIGFVIKSVKSIEHFIVIEGERP